MKVVGTAGHVDHGKSSLVRRLTGVDPDRLEEEKRRGMTIDLGFAPLRLPSGLGVSLVDVPGHERLIKNMLAGAGGIDAALVVIAADEGVMPQTVEHLDILDLLDVRSGVIVLSKSDLVDAEWIDMVQADVRAALSGRSLAAAPIVSASAANGAGIDLLLETLDSVLARGISPHQMPMPYLPVDRVFTAHGYGTVVAGTLHGGSLVRGDQVELLPSGMRGRIRGLQTHGEALERVEAGQRVAINIGGVPRGDVQRGAVVSIPGEVPLSDKIDALIRVLSGTGADLDHLATVSAHFGSAEYRVRIAMLDRQPIRPGEYGWARVQFEQPVPVLRGQRVVFRMPAPVGTVAGGIIADVQPRGRSVRSGDVERLRSLLSADVDEVVRASLAGRGAMTAGQLPSVLSLAPADARAAVRRLIASNEVVSLGESVIAREGWAQLRSRAVSHVEQFHGGNPLERGIPREELRRRLGWSTEIWGEVLERLTAEGVIEIRDTVVSLPGRRSVLSREDDIVTRVLSVLERAGSSPPALPELLTQTGCDARTISALAREGLIVKISDDLYYAPESYCRVKTTIVDLIRTRGEATAANVRDATGTSRKYAVALLEHLDAERVTRRKGDVRVLAARS